MADDPEQQLHGHQDIYPLIREDLDLHPTLRAAADRMYLALLEASDQLYERERQKRRGDAVSQVIDLDQLAEPLPPEEAIRHLRVMASTTARIYELWERLPDAAKRHTEAQPSDPEVAVENSVVEAVMRWHPETTRFWVVLFTRAADLIEESLEFASRRDP